jgi:transcriptional regulator with XRE-family HTH domain
MDHELVHPTITFSNITRTNARHLADSVGGLARFAEKVGVADSQVSQIIGKNPSRNIGSKMARKIEAAFEKSIGWLDKPHDGSDFDDISAASQVILLSAELAAVRDRAKKASVCLRASLSAPDIDKANLLNLAMSLLEET